MVSHEYNGERYNNTDTSPTVGLGGNFKINDSLTVNIEGRKFLSGSEELFGSAGFTFWFK